MNMKQYLRSVLMDKEITDLTADKKVYLIHAPNATAPYVTYTFFDEWGAAFAENDEIATNYSIQVDIFSKGDFTDLEEKIKEKTTNNGFRRTSSADFYESDTGLYHCAIRFNYTKTEV